MFSSLGLACMAYTCDLLVMIFHWDGVLPRLTMDFASLSIFGITMVLWVYFFVFMVSSHVSFRLG